MKTTPKLIEATYVDDYRIHVIFDDGTEGELDMENELWGPVFEPLKDKNIFRMFRIDNELRTIVWPSGADLAPEYLYKVAAA